MGAAEFDPERFRRGTKCTIAVAILVGSIGCVLTSALFYLLHENKKVSDAAENAMRTVLPVTAGFVGSLLVYWRSTWKWKCKCCACRKNRNKAEENTERSSVFEVSNSMYNVVFKRQDFSPAVYGFDASHSYEGNRTMAEIMEILQSDDPSFFDHNQDEEKGQRGTVLCFSLMQHQLLTKKIHNDAFRQLTISKLLGMTSESVTTIEIEVTVEAKSMLSQKSILSGYLNSGGQ
jgi:hypothetical protein